MIILKQKYPDQIDSDITMTIFALLSKKLAKNSLFYNSCCFSIFY